MEIHFHCDENRAIGSTIKDPEKVVYRAAMDGGIPYIEDGDANPDEQWTDDEIVAAATIMAINNTIFGDGFCCVCEVGCHFRHGELFTK